MKKKNIINKKQKNNSNIDINSSSYRFKEMLKYEKNDEHFSDADLTIKYDIVKPEIKYMNFYENWIEKNIGSDKNNKNIKDISKTKK